MDNKSNYPDLLEYTEIPRHSKEENNKVRSKLIQTIKVIHTNGSVVKLLKVLVIKL